MDKKKLMEFAISQMGKTFAWGEIDCVSLTRKAIEHSCGDEIFKDLSSWKNKFGALRTYIKQGSPSSYLRRSGHKEISSGYIQTGDIAIIDSKNDLETACVVINGELLVIDKDYGVRCMLIPKDKKITFFRIDKKCLK